MSYMKKGLRRSQQKNVLERKFISKYKYHKNFIDNMSDTERDLETKTSYKKVSKFMKSNLIHFGTLLRNNNYETTDGMRNYNNCVGFDGKFIQRKFYPESVMDHLPLIDLDKVQSLEVFEKYGDKDRLFHLTTPKNWDKIRNYGLISKHRNHNYRGRENRLYFVQSYNNEILNSVGFGQITSGCNGVPLVVLEIDKKGITGDLFGEEGGEYSTPFHTVLVNQKRILPQYIKYRKTIVTDERKYYDFRPEVGEGKSEFYKNEFGMERDQLKMMGIDDKDDGTRLKDQLSNIENRREYYPQIPPKSRTKRINKKYQKVS